MELEENCQHACKRSCVSNGHPATRIGHKERQHQDEDEEDGDKRKGGHQGGASISSGGNCLMPWQKHPSSRIFRVSRASGGKDRHSKVYTAKGLRDRRVRLSVSTAIQFYDLQDRLGYDQPSKAIEWLIKAATAAIDELPSLDNFLRLPSQHPIDEDKAVEADQEGVPNYNDQQQQHLSTKSGCSSNSETSKGSVLSLSRSENHIKKRDRERIRAVKERDEGGGHAEDSQQQKNLSSNLNTHSSFTELLTAGGGRASNRATTTIVSAIAPTVVESKPNSIPKQIPAADYFSQTGLFTQSHKTPQLASSFSSPSNFGHCAALGMMPFNVATAMVASPGDNQEMHQFSFLQDHHIPVSAAAEHNLNFSMSSGFAGFNRGTLQSNSSSQLPHHNHQQHHSNHNHLQHGLPYPIDGSNLPLFFGAATAVANIAENQFPPGFDGRLQLYYGEGFQHCDLNRKTEN